MEKSTLSTSSANPGVQFTNTSPAALVENVIEYIMLGIYEDEVRYIISNKEGRHERFCKDVGLAVLILMTENLDSPICCEITETVSACESRGADSYVTEPLDFRMRRFEEYLEQPTELGSLKYLAAVCELITRLYKSTVSYGMIERVINKAKLSMTNYAEKHSSYMFINLDAEDFLKEHKERN